MIRSSWVRMTINHLLTLRQSPRWLMSGAMAVIFLSPLTLSGCVTRYHGTLTSISGLGAEPPSTLEAKKLPLKVALLRNKALQGRPFTARGGGYGVEIDFADSLARALAESLTNTFVEARLIEWANTARQEEIVAEYDLTWRELHRDLGEGRYVFASTIVITLKDSQGVGTIGRYDHTQRVEYHTPDVAKTAEILGLLSLGLLLPITSAIVTQSIGQEAMRLVQRTIRTSAAVVSERILTDTRLWAYARGEGRETAERESQVERPRDAAATPRAPAEPPREQRVATQGTAFAVTPNGIFLTAFHVVEGNNAITLKCPGRSPVQASVLEATRNIDLATLRAPLAETAYLTLADARSLRAGEPVFAIGFPAPELLGYEAKFTDGSVSALSGPGGEASFVQMAVPVQPGNSGGPLLNNTGDVVGIVTASAAVIPFLTVTGTLPQNVAWAVKAEYAFPLFDRPPKLKAASDRAEAIERAKKATCLVEGTR